VKFRLKKVRGLLTSRKLIIVAIVAAVISLVAMFGALTVQTVTAEPLHISTPIRSISLHQHGLFGGASLAGQERYSDE